MHPKSRVEWVRGQPPETAALPCRLRFADTAMELRFIASADLGRLVEFFASLTPTRGSDADATTHFGPDYGARLLELNQSRDATIGVFDLDHEQQPLVAVGWYTLRADEQTGDAGVVVRRDFRRLGIATALVRVLAIIAHERGLALLTTYAQSEFDPIVRVFGQFNAQFSRADAEHGLQVALPMTGLTDLRPTNGPPGGEHWHWAESAERLRARLQNSVSRWPPVFPLP